MSKIRLNKFIAIHTNFSRREADSLIENEEVKINNEICKELGTKIDPEKDKIEINNKEIKVQNFTYLILNKPEGYTCTKKDPFEKQTIYKLLPEKFQHLHYVGRLDKNSSGLLILTNDGDLSQKITKPKTKLKKIYKVKVHKKISEQQLNEFRKGATVDFFKYKPAQVETSDFTNLEITLTEGKNRQIRRVLGHFGLEVLQLHRTQIGPIHLEDLQSGHFKEIEKIEI